VVAILERPDSTFADVAHLVRGVAGRELLEGGNLDGGLFWAGQCQGLITDIPSVGDLVSRIVAEAERIIESRLHGAIRR
jgi:nitronate monooxygenase